MSRWLDYHQLLQPFVVRCADAVIEAGSKHRLGSGCAGDVFECKLRGTGEYCVMKTAKMDLQMWAPNGESGSTNQRWLREDCEGDGDYFVLFNEAFPSRVLELYMEGPNAPAQLYLGEHRPRVRHQKWRLDASGCLLSKLNATSCIACSSGEKGAQLRVEQRSSENAGKQQTWSFKPVGGGAVLIAAALSDLVIDFVGETDSRELYYLARWKTEPGLVPLRHVVWGAGSVIIMKRLGKQLGPGTAAFDKADCVLKDIREVKARARSPAQAAQQLLAVACFLRRMHLDGYAHNDLHDGNILQDGCSAALPFSVIDLGSVNEAGHWKRDLGSAYGRAWSITRDWRAFALHFVSLIDGVRRDVWDLVGTNNKLPKLDTEWAVPCRVRIAANTPNGSHSQKWTVDNAKKQILNRGNGKALDLIDDDSCTVISQPPHKGLNQRWACVDGSIENSAKRLKLDICGGIEGVRVIAYSANEGENQQWRHDEKSGEIVNPASRKVLDVNGESRLPQEIQHLIAACEHVDPVFVQLLEALFKARSDPNEICALVGLLGSRC